MSLARPDLSPVFDSADYAPTLGRKLWRAVELGPRYYVLDLPRYFFHRRRLRLPLGDWTAFWNPVRSFRKSPYVGLPLPPRFLEALLRLRDAGIRISLPLARFEALVGAWWSVREVRGDVMECGAYRGTTSLFLALLGDLHAVGQRVLMLDTFTGMPAPTPYDHYRSAGEYAPGSGGVEAIRKQAEALGVAGRVEIHQGLFSDTFSRMRERPLSLSFVHIDANLFQSTREACEFTIPRVVPGGVVVFDDYNGLCDLGARLAIDSCLAGRGLRPAPLAECSAYLTL